LLVSFRRIALIAAMSASLAACGSQSDAGQPGTGTPNPGVSQPPASDGNPNPGPSTGGNPGATSSNSACGIFSTKPSRDQYLDDQRKALGAAWDDPKWGLQQGMTREDYINVGIGYDTDHGYGPLSKVEVLAAAPLLGPTQFGQFYCDMAKPSNWPNNQGPATEPYPSAELNMGLEICERLSGDRSVQASSERELTLQKTAKQDLCPQLPHNPTMIGEEGGQR
jgi:hypothetical protein